MWHRPYIGISKVNDVFLLKARMLIKYYHLLLSFFHFHCLPDTYSMRYIDCRFYNLMIKRQYHMTNSIWPTSKLWKCNRSRAKFCFILWSNHLLIDFFLSEFVVRIQIIPTKSIPATQKKIEKFEINRLYSKRDQNRSIMIENVKINQLLI